MNKKRWFRFHIERWFHGTFGLNPNEIAAYITILCELYDNEGFCKLDAEIMARRCGMRPSSFHKAVARLIELRKLDVHGGFITNKSVSEEISEREKLSKKLAKSRRNPDKITPKSSMKTGEITKNSRRIQNKENRIRDSVPDGNVARAGNVVALGETALDIIGKVRRS